MLRTASLALLLLVATAPQAEERRHIADPARSTLPFSDGVIVGDTLYLGGHLGLDAKTGKPPADAAEEARLVMDAVKQTVEKAGMTMADIVMIQVHCPDPGLYDAFNKVYRTYFQDAYPGRAFLGSGRLLFGARFEVLGIAVRTK